MIKEVIHSGVIKTVKKLYGTSAPEFVIEKSKNNFGDYATNVAFILAKELKKSPQEIAEVLSSKLQASRPEELERIEAVGGYVNFFLATEFVQQEFAKIAHNENFGFTSVLKGKTVIVEYTDPNPFKKFHIGHLMSNTIGESIARLHEAVGARVLRVTWQGDVGMHIAMAVYGIQKGQDYLGPAYTFGAQAYKNDTTAKIEIEAINKKIYDHSDPSI